MDATRNPGISQRDDGFLSESLDKDIVSRDQIKSTLLIVEDNLDMHEFISGLFENEYFTHSAYNGLEGLNLLKKNQFDLVIADVMMPEMNGFEMLEALRKEENHKSTPVIILTSLVEENFKIQALSIGVDDYLTKPFSPNELRARVRNMISRYKIRNDQLHNVPKDQESKIEVWKREESNAFIKKVEDIVVREFENEEFKLDDLASHFNLGERQFRRRMKLITGLSPKDFQREVSLQKARELLENHQYDNLSAVAFSVGIRNTTRFAELYEKRFGTDPRKYFLF